MIIAGHGTFKWMMQTFLAYQQPIPSVVFLVCEFINIRLFLITCFNLIFVTKSYYKSRVAVTFITVYAFLIIGLWCLNKNYCNALTFASFSAGPVLRCIVVIFAYLDSSVINNYIKKLLMISVTDSTSTYEAYPRIVHSLSVQLIHHPSISTIKFRC